MIAGVTQLEHHSIIVSKSKGKFSISLGKSCFFVCLQQLAIWVILSDQRESKDLRTQILLSKNENAWILRRATLAQNDTHSVALRSSANVSLRGGAAPVAIRNTFLENGFPRQFANWLGMTIIAGLSKILQIF